MNMLMMKASKGRRRGPPFLIVFSLFITHVVGLSKSTSVLAWSILVAVRAHDPVRFAGERQSRRGFNSSNCKFTDCFYNPSQRICDCLLSGRGTLPKEREVNPGAEVGRTRSQNTLERTGSDECGNGGGERQRTTILKERENKGYSCGHRRIKFLGVGLA